MRRYGGERAQQLAAYLQRVLAGNPFLLVLDDVWRWEQAQPFLSFALPGAAMLLTSRDEGLAHRFGKTATTKVAEVNEEDALALLHTLSPAASTADPQGMRELARATGGLPLALVLIGSRVAEEGDQDWRDRDDPDGPGGAVLGPAQLVRLAIAGPCGGGARACAGENHRPAPDANDPLPRGGFSVYTPVGVSMPVSR